MKKLLFTCCLSAGIAFSASAQCNTTVLEAFGGAASIALYNTYITIGAIADAYVAKAYDADRVKDLMDEQISMMNVITGQFDKALSEGGLKTGDKDFIRSAIECVTHLQNEARGLSEYAEEGSGNELYSSSRNEAWKLISKLLGLKE